MPARDIYHAAVIKALIADGWTITNDPLYLAYRGRELYVDIGAERVTIAAERDNQKIAVEIKNFLSPSPVSDLQEAVGKYEAYRSVLKELQPKRQLYLAVPKRVYEGIFSERFGQPNS
ncbi:XisH family protein [Nostoc sphaeroides CHAB 2801]|uniref:element excision factor XisH family protein n=1 Tax=Nostoc sphaeroides TaxID=446679 RepID=UPI000E4DCBB0|nr:element excision factor XisH family protein [Nostoc sphaeroides]MCC5628985.1 XisH family protein [Nostoc sphaeroides CHAB 2801]